MKLEAANAIPWHKFMNRRVPGWPVPVTAESKIGMSWKEV